MTVYQTGKPRRLTCHVRRATITSNRPIQTEKWNNGRYSDWILKVITL